MSQHKRTVVCVVGTRPEVIKMAPVIRALQASEWARCVVVATAQHRELLDQMLGVFSIVADHDLDLMVPGQLPASLMAKMLPAVDGVLAAERADIVLAQGDTSSVFVAALAAFHRKIPFGHVEAGLRTGDLNHPFPEEGYRQMVSRIARWHFAPTARARSALLAEGIADDAIAVTGNTCIDALVRTVSELGELVPSQERVLLLTVHRRESFGEPLQNVFKAIRQIVDSRSDVRVVYPVHPNPNVESAAKAHLSGHPRIQLLPPQDYVSFVSLMRGATIILTDSGGIQEEAPVLDKPVLVLRETTERPEAVEAGCSLLVGLDTNRIVAETCALLDDTALLQTMTGRGSPYGDGKAASRIVDLIARGNWKANQSKSTTAA